MCLLPNKRDYHAMADTMNTPQHNAMLEFLSTFTTISQPPETIADLADGVVIFEALHEM